MTVANNQPCLSAGTGESKPIYGIVQSPLEKLQQGLAGDSSLTLRSFEIDTKLLFQQPVYAFDFLLFAKLQTVALNPRSTALALLTRGEIAILDGALFRQAALPLQEELRSFAPTKPAYRTSVPSQEIYLLKPAFSWAGGIRCAGLGSHL
jgi:hypothetical protein